MQAMEMIRIVLGAALIAAIGAADLLLSIEAARAAPTSLAEERSRKSLGIFVAPVPPGAKGVLLLDKDRGMVVVGLVPGGLAERAGGRKFRGGARSSTSPSLFDQTRRSIAVVTPHFSLDLIR